MRIAAISFSAAALLCASACGGGGPAPVKAPPPVEASEAEAGARDLIAEIYRSLGRGDAGGMLGLLSPQLVVIGPDPTTVYLDKSAAIVALTDAFDGLGKHKIKSKSLVVFAAPKGHSAWAVDKVTFDGATYLMAAVLTEADELWEVAAVSLSRPVKDKEVADAVRPASLPATTTPDAAAILAIFQEAIAGREEAIDQLDEDALLVGRNGTISDGSDKVAKAWIKPVKKPKKKKKKKKKKHAEDEVEAPPPPPPSAMLDARSDPHIAFTPDGDLAWVVADVDVAEPDAAAVPLRFFYVYARAGDDWRLVVAHEAAFTPP
jgi:ketosteroid isomerase-like protein